MVRSREIQRVSSSNSLFWMSLAVSFASLVVYRATMHAPVWFDEVFVKAILFGGPIWLYARKSKQHHSFYGLETKRFWIGAFNGLALGGLFGFVAMIASSYRKTSIFIPGLFQSNLFWGEFSLAFATAWWESLFFYGFILPVLKEKTRSEIDALAYATLLFLVFHLPNLLLKVGIAGALQPLLLLGFFAFGQGILYLRTKSLATVIVSHAFWGMALLVYGR